MVACALWFPDGGGPLDTVHLAMLEPDEWAGLAEWAAARSAELPALASLLSASLPARLPPAGVSALAAECGRVDWDALAGSTLGGFAALSLVVSQAAGQAGAGLRFATEM
ncbi:MAG TPA: hypothetical protein VGF55_24835 [Gemmataceae bacterium]